DRPRISPLEKLPRVSKQVPLDIESKVLHIRNAVTVVIRITFSREERLDGLSPWDGVPDQIITKSEIYQDRRFIILIVDIGPVDVFGPPPPHIIIRGELPIVLGEAVKN